MSQLLLVGTYRPGQTVLHRLPVGPKVALLAVFSLVVVLVRSLPASGVCLALVLVTALVGRVPLGAVLRALRGLAVLLVVVSAVQWWVNGLARAAETTLDLVALAVAALVLTTTTPVNALLDALIRWLRPLRRLGVDPERVALAFSLAIAALPATLALALETRDAARARGLGRHPRAYLTPFVVRVVARAHDTGDALHARGLGD
ncbi:CbiQ family ECF transporter T component [Nocardioides deserti]|uniref:Energy-coupling factor transporter transmembrane protein EcfT n=1 Tax=Nocardioides deserti TaxID=1588644 RepID=A0ABR6UCZ2_9ACTN|nr:CbiQ family ECF transporter T component [Nocardioides deserti]MBC2962240.1 energy-coupling factor transporter transmembrane protein EcfT [Nocardioides deserti]GGO70360.1 cobalt ABC transporter [Nocardioides deserti]